MPAIDLQSDTAVQPSALTNSSHLLIDDVSQIAAETDSYATFNSFDFQDTAYASFRDDKR